MFEASDDGFLYRRNSRSAAVLVTREERDTFLREFRSRYWKYQLCLWGAVIGLMLLAVGLSPYFGAPKAIGTATGYLIVITLALYFFFIQRHLFSAPDRSLVGRMPAKPARTRHDVRMEQIGKASWRSHIATGIVFAGIAWLTFPEHFQTRWITIVWASYFSLFFGLWGRNIWQKFQMERNPPS